MTDISFRGKTLLLLLAVLLALPWGLAAEPRRAAASRTAREAPAPAVSLAGWLGSLLRSLWGEEGHNIDPNGLSTVPPPPGPPGGSDAGSNIDPDGLKADEGSNLDPNGLEGDEGLNIDPDG